MKPAVRLTMERKAEQLEEIRLRNGGILTRRAVVDAARVKSHPLHGEFDWNDKSAAEAHRLEQAGELIRSITLVIVTEERRLESVAYVRAPTAGHREAGYTTVELLRGQPAASWAALEAEVDRIEALLVRGRSIASAIGLEMQWDDVLMRLVALRRPPMMEAAE